MSVVGSSVLSHEHTHVRTHTDAIVKLVKLFKILYPNAHGILYTMFVLHIIVCAACVFFVNKHRKYDYGWLCCVGFVNAQFSLQ